MGPFEKKIGRLPRSVGELLTEFRQELSEAVGENLVGAYVFGSAAFPDYDPHSGDIDFYAVLRKQPTSSGMRRLDRMHRHLTAKFEHGARLDGFYITRAKAGKSLSPKGLVDASHGRVHSGGVDYAWALHREHFHGSAYIRLYGPSPSRIFPPPDWESIRQDLYRQLVYARKIIDTDAWWSVLNLCRLIYSFEKGRVVISKLGAARWALHRLPLKWHRVIRSAIRTYKGTAGDRDRGVLRSEARKFLGFASVRIIAFDSTWNPRKSLNRHFRKKTRVGGP